MGRILVVDDSHFMRTVLARSVQEQGHEAITAKDGREALDILSKEQVDLVLLDVVMPEMDGFGVLKLMMADPNLQHIPVIMISAVDETESAIRCIEMGAQDYLPKPADPLLLRARMNASLARKRLRDMEMLYLRQIEREKRRADDLLNVVIPIGVSLSAERDFAKLLDRILGEATAFCHASGGTLYLRTDDGCLRVVAARYDAEAGGAEAAKIQLEGPPVPLDDQPVEDPSVADPSVAHRRAEDQPVQPLAAYVARSGQVVNIPDCYQDQRFDFSAIQRLDQQTGHRSVSLLALPLRSQAGRVIGVIQLVNARDPQTGTVIPFDNHLQQMMTSLSTLAAVALENYEREARLRREIEALRIEIDEERKAHAVSELTDTDFFRQLQEKVKPMRQRMRRVTQGNAPSLVDKEGTR